MAIPTEEDVFIDTLGAPMRDLIDGLHAGYVKVLIEKDGTPHAFVIDAETYDQLVHLQADVASPSSVDDVIHAPESALKELGKLSPYERGQLLMLVDAQRGIRRRARRSSDFGR